MKKRETIRRLAGRLAVAATLLTLCCGFGHSLSCASAAIIEEEDYLANDSSAIFQFDDTVEGISDIFRNLQSCNDTVQGLTERIDALLLKHDLCEKGVMNPDSAVYYSISALEIADDMYDTQSEVYVDIFTEYFMNDLRDDIHSLQELLYPSVKVLFDPSSQFGWRPFYILGRMLSLHNDYEKANELYNIVFTKSSSALGRVSAGMELAKFRSKKGALDLQLAYMLLYEEIAEIESPDKETILLEMAIDLSEYCLKTGNDAMALKYILQGERLKGMASNRKMLLLLYNKYRYFRERDHIKAIECLDEAIGLLSEDTEEADRKWIAQALLVRGDYAWNELLNITLALKYYMQAFNMISPPYQPGDSTISSLVWRILHFLNLGGDYSLAIEFGGNYLYQRPVNEIVPKDYPILFELIEAYLNSGDTSAAEAIMETHKEVMYADSYARNRACLMESKISLAKGDYLKASREIEAIIENHEFSNRSDEVWAQRYLATAYSHLDDPRKEALSDSINLSAKRSVARQFWLIPPNERTQWLGFCIEATQHQLSLPNNPRAIRNAAELNLFRKGLLFRTDAHIGRVFSGLPEASAQTALLDSLRRARIEAMNRGDSANARSLTARADTLRQSISTRFLGADLLMREMQSPIEDVTKHLEPGKIALDFFVDELHDELEIGTFLYSHDADPVYVPLFHDSIPEPSDLPALIWKPLLPYIEGAEEVYFSADDRLNTIPIEFLPFDGEQTLDRMRLHRVFHLSQIKPPSFVGDSLVFVGVSDYDSDSDSKGFGWAGLEGTDSELESIRRNFPPSSVGIIMNEEATERKIRSLAGSPVSALHFSTHGIFRSHEELAQESDSLQSATGRIAQHWLAVSDDPLSGLALHAPASDDITPTDDLLTAEEVELMSFPKLNLTVLSACDTGLGAVDSEGVWGLQRAFRIAGAKSLICSLAKIDDYWTAQFMDAFYEHAARGNSIYDSFRIAQRWLRRELPDNPEVWGAFILIE